MGKTFYDILNEEQIKFQSEIAKSQKGYNRIHLYEDYNLISNLDNLRQELYDEKNFIPNEHWDWFKKVMIALSSNEDFVEYNKFILCKLYALKNFAKINFILSDNLESELKYELKSYISLLRVQNSDELIDVIKSLPFEFVSLLVRYNTSILNKDKKEQLSPSVKMANAYVAYLTKLKEGFIKSVNKISRGEENVFSIIDAKELLDTRAFFDDNDLNAATLEFMIRMFNSDNSSQELYKRFGKSLVIRMKEQALLHPCYIHFLERVADGEEPFFTDKGLQNKTKEVSFNDLVTKQFNPKSFIPNATPSNSIEAPQVIEPTAGELTQGEENIEEPEKP